MEYPFLLHYLSSLILKRLPCGNPDATKLQFPHEARKITSAEKHFAAFGIDYRHITPDTLDWDKPAPQKPPRLRGIQNKDTNDD